MNSTQVIIRSCLGSQQHLPDASSVLALANPLYPAAELLEREMASRSLLTENDLILWDINALKNDAGWSGWGYVFWLRRAGVYEPTNGLWHNAGFIAKGSETPGSELYNALGKFDVYFNMSGYMSRDGAEWAYPTGSPMISQCADILADEAKKKVA